MKRCMSLHVILIRIEEFVLSDGNVQLGLSSFTHQLRQFLTEERTKKLFLVHVDYHSVLHNIVSVFSLPVGSVSMDLTNPRAFSNAFFGS